MSTITTNKPVSADLVLENAASIKKVKEAIGAIQTAEQEVQEKLGPTVFTPEGILTPQSRARLIPTDKDATLLEAVREVIANPEAARAVADHILFSSMAGVVLSSLQGASDSKKSPLLDLYQVKFDESRALISGSFTASQKTNDRAIGEAINAESQRLYGRNAIHPWILESCESKTVNQGETSTVSDARNSNNKTPSQQEQFLAGRNEQFASALKTAIIAGFYRLEKGFPESGVGTSSDPGDFFGGDWARVALDKKSGVGVLYSSDAGVCGSGYDGGDAGGHVLAAGSPNLKKA